jgi:hypothetical protein
MRKITLFSLLVLSVNFVFCQAFGSKGAEWKYSLVNKINGQQKVATYQCDSVYVFNSKMASRFKLVSGQISGFSCPTEVDEELIGYGADSVFIYEDGRWQLLVDLSASNFDTTTVKVSVSNGQQTVTRNILIEFDSVRTTVISGVTLRQVYMRHIGTQTAYQFHDGWFTEHIGHEYSIIPWAFSTCTNSSNYTYGLRCFSDSLLGSLNFTSIGCDSVLTSISKNELVSSKINVFPNPSNGLISISSPEAISRIQLFGVTGQTILIQPNGNNQLDVSSLESGIYFLSITLKEGAVVSKRIIKE